MRFRLRGSACCGLYGNLLHGSKSQRENNSKCLERLIKTLSGVKGKGEKQSRPCHRVFMTRDDITLAQSESIAREKKPKQEKDVANNLTMIVEIVESKRNATTTNLIKNGP